MRLCRPWTPAEVAQLRRLYPITTTRHLASRLGRSVAAVHGKAFALGIRKRMVTLNHSVSDLSRIFGVSESTIRWWASHDRLRASQPDGNAWRVTDQAIEDFILSDWGRRRLRIEAMQGRWKLSAWRSLQGVARTCRNGHALIGRNVYRRPDGYTECRECRYLRGKTLAQRVA